MRQTLILIDGAEVSCSQSLLCVRANERKAAETWSAEISSFVMDLDGRNLTIQLINSSHWAEGGGV